MSKNIPAGSLILTIPCKFSASGTHELTITLQRSTPTALRMSVRGLGTTCEKAHAGGSQVFQSTSGTCAYNKKRVLQFIRGKENCPIDLVPRSILYPLAKQQILDGFDSPVTRVEPITTDPVALLALWRKLYLKSIIPGVENMDLVLSKEETGYTYSFLQYGIVFFRIKHTGDLMYKRQLTSSICSLCATNTREKHDWKIHQNNVEKLHDTIKNMPRYSPKEYNLALARLKNLS